ncbi:MAG: hypothetical protein VYE77_09935 [Planctomycetota bacterium]|nr:hypothetical protein [Planctomycetota bacterium]
MRNPNHFPGADPEDPTSATAPRASRFARCYAARWIESALLAALLLPGLGLLAAEQATGQNAPATNATSQQSRTSPTARLLVADAARWIQSKDPTIRGEAALVLASQPSDRHRDHIAEVARAEPLPARLRGILALGYLGMPGNELYLEQLIDQSRTRAQPDGIAAAFSIGTLPPERLTSTITTYLSRVVGMSLTRQGGILLALLAALNGDAMPPSHLRAALRQLLDEGAVRDPALRQTLLRAYGRIPGAVDDALFDHILQDGEASERLALLQALGEVLATQRKTDPDRVSRFVELAHKDPDPAVRAAALALLTQARHEAALQLAETFLASSHPVEVRQGTSTAVQLLGARVYQMLAKRLPTLTPANQTAMLQALSGPMPKDLQDACMPLATDRKLPLALRTAALLALSSAQVKTVRPLLRDAFLENEDPTTLVEVACAIQELHESPPDLSRLHRGAKPEDLLSDTWRLRALLVAGHPRALRLCMEQLRNEDAEPQATANLLRAIRLSLLPTPDTHSELPEPVHSLLL